jgi:hypothetical protein
MSQGQMVYKLEVRYEFYFLKYELFLVYLFMQKKLKPRKLREFLPPQNLS